MRRYILSSEHLECRSLLAGDVAFADNVELSVGGGRDYPTDMVAADFDGDGNPDLAVAAQSTASVNLLFGDGHGNFGEPVVYPVADGSNRVTTGDFDNDGAPDLALGHFAGVDVLRNDGKGVFPAATQEFFDAGITGVPRWVISGDIDGDGDLDLAVGNSGGPRSQYADAGINILINKGVTDNQWQGFAEPLQHKAGITPASALLKDLDGDGDLDLAVVNSLWFSNRSTNDVSVLLNEGNGAFAKETRYAVGDGPHTIAAGDLDGDGDMDLVLGKSTTVGQLKRIPNGKISVLLGKGDGTFLPTIDRQVAPTDRQTWPVLIADFNDDGDLDLAVSTIGPRSRSGDAGGAERIRDVRILLGNGDATFQDPVNIADARAYVFSDLDNDGDLDLAGINFFRHNVSVAFNRKFNPTPIGDSNLDGVFNQLDIVHTLQAAKYLTGEPATFGEGDWNGDNVFDQLDIVAVLATGNYLLG